LQAKIEADAAKARGRVEWLVLLPDGAGIAIQCGRSFADAVIYKFDCDAVLDAVEQCKCNLMTKSGFLRADLISPGQQ